MIQASALSSVRPFRSSREEARRVDAGVLGSGDGVEVPEEISPGARETRNRSAMIHHGRECDASQKGHANQLERAVVHFGVRQDLDDVGMANPGHEPGLSRGPGGELHDHLPALEVGLLGQEDPGKGPSPQLAPEQVRSDLVADLGEDFRVGNRRDRSRPRGGRALAVDREQALQRRTMFGKTCKEDFWVGLSASQFSQAILAVDQLDSQPRRPLSEQLEIILDAGDLAAFPAASEILKRGLVLEGKRRARGVDRVQGRQ